MGEDIHMVVEFNHIFWDVNLLGYTLKDKEYDFYTEPGEDRKWRKISYQTAVHTGQSKVNVDKLTKELIGSMNKTINKQIKK